MQILPILITGFALFLTLLPLFIKAFKKYRRFKIYSQILNQIHLLFNSVNPFQIAAKSRAHLPYSSDFHYGEIELCALLDLLAFIPPKAHDVFYDLGSGCAKAIIAVKLRYPFLKVVGIEALPGLYELGQQKVAEYCKTHAVPPEEFNVQLIEGNFLNQDLSQASILLINATAFSVETWEKIVPKLFNLKANAKIILISKQLPTTHFKQCYQGMEKMSWGFASTSIYQKNACL